MKMLSSIILVAVAVTAFAADTVIERAPGAAAGTDSPTDASLTLRWDSGYSKWMISWPTGAGAWVGNDFDISTVSTFSHIRAVRVLSSYVWPNGVWDGYRVGVYAFAGVPASLLWPTSGGGRFVVPTGSNGWKDLPVNWTLPGGTHTFLAAIEQCYDYPNCDPFIVDNNHTFLLHSWQYYRGPWEALDGVQVYRNLMLRVVVDNETVSVAPTSVGRVKALYY
jgi:hypothetical protein